MGVCNRWDGPVEALCEGSAAAADAALAWCHDGLPMAMVTLSDAPPERGFRVRG